MLSVIVIAKNEETRIRACLESVKWVDEIIIADNGSLDKTLEIAKRYTDKIVRFSGQDFSTLRNKAMELASGDWVLYVDADERVLEDLKGEIKSLVKRQESAAYAVSRRNIIFGTEVNYGPYKHDWVIRLFKKNNFKGWVGKVHEYGTYEGTLGYTKNSLLHLTHRDLDHFMSKTLDWSRIDAKLRIDNNHPKMNGWRFLRILISEAFNQGILRKGFFAGTVGVIDSMLQVFSMFVTYIRLWEMQQKPQLNKKYDQIDKKLVEDNFKF